MINSNDLKNGITIQADGNTTDRLDLNKYCPKCGRHTEHKEKN